MEWDGETAEAVLEEAIEFMEDSEVMEFFLEPMAEGDGVAGGVAATEDRTEVTSTAEAEASSMICSQDSGRVPGADEACKVMTERRIQTKFLPICLASLPWRACEPPLPLG